MSHYKGLAVRYLKMNKRRSIITVIGVAVAVAVLYTLLNLGWSALLSYRERQREKSDYEIVLFTETERQMEQVMADERVKSAYVGTYYDYYTEKQYDNALYVNTVNPYRMDSVFEYLKATYGVEGDINVELEIAYMQGDEANLIFITMLFILLISFIFAIFGIGIVRNSIQLCNLEQIRDYGNLRCIGATKGQMKAIVYLEGMILEVAGNVAGIVIGSLCSMVAGYLLGIKAGFHIIPVILILVAFLGDLYFAMEESCKVIVNLTPVSAIRGEYRIRREKIRLRRKSMFGRLFGVEGDYAYKSIMRNPGRFLKTVWAIGIGIAASITVMGIISTANGMVQQVNESYRYYQVYYKHELEPYETIDEVQSSLPPTEVLGQISDMEEVTEAKQIYSAGVLLADWEEFYSHYTEDYLEQTVGGEAYKRISEEMKENEDEVGYFANRMMTQLSCCGYDEEDYARLAPALVEGTLDISENGLVLVNCCKEMEKDNEDYTEFGDGSIDVIYTDYKVGDTVSLVDMEKLRSMVDEGMRAFRVEYEKEHDGKGSSGQTEEEEPDAYSEKRLELVRQYRKELVREGAYRTYTIEGIVSRDDNTESGVWKPIFVLPLKNYYEVTGTDEAMVTGMQYHFERFPVNKFFRVSSYDSEGGTGWCDYSLYPEMMQLIGQIKNGCRGVMVFVVFIVMMSAFNIINTAASSLHLRKKEMAQLRVIGVSQKQLMKMVMLEGVITTAVANGIGMVLGMVIHLGAFGRLYRDLLGIEYRFPLVAAVLGVLLSALLLCGSVYVPLKGLKLDMASDLATGGE